MDYPVIPKDPDLASRHNLVDYQQACASFDWEEARAQLQGFPDGGVNICFEAIDRHALDDRADQVAIRWISKAGERRDFTYGALHSLTNEFANALRALGVVEGQRVFGLMGRIPELYISLLGTLKRGAVFCPLFSAFGPDPIKQRVTRGDGKVLVTTPELYREKVAPIRDELESLEHVILVGGEGEVTSEPDTHDFWKVTKAATSRFDIARTQPEDMALLHFTSGTTGMPKGAIHVHGAVVAHHITGQLALDLHPEDTFWCTADPGWVTGTSYGVIAPLTNGATMIVDEGEFSARRWYEILAEENVDILYTAPTAIRMLMKAGPDLSRDFDLSSLRFVASVGEPLNPEAVIWGKEVLGRPIHDNWWQTETGGIMIANYAAMPIKPGSMGRPLPGIEATVLPQNVRGAGPIPEPNAHGELALRAGWPSMFRGYIHDPERYEKCFDGPWYRTGDIAYRDEDGYFWFVGRADDLIKSAGHLIGPFEVESSLIEHPAVAEAAVIGVPHPVSGEAVKAFVTLNPGFEAGRDLEREIKGFAREKLGSAVAPRELVIVDELPKTRSGKIMRRLLKARELGLPEGDTSTLETGR